MALTRARIQNDARFQITCAGDHANDPFVVSLPRDLQIPFSTQDHYRSGVDRLSSSNVEFFNAIRILKDNITIHLKDSCDNSIAFEKTCRAFAVALTKDAWAGAI